MYLTCILHVFRMYLDVNHIHQDTSRYIKIHQDTSRYIKIHQDTFVSVTLAIIGNDEAFSVKTYLFMVNDWA